MIIQKRWKGESQEFGELTCVSLSRAALAELMPPPYLQGRHKAIKKGSYNITLAKSKGIVSVPGYYPLRCNVSQRNCGTTCRQQKSAIKVCTPNIFSLTKLLKEKWEMVWHTWVYDGKKMLEKRNKGVTWCRYGCKITISWCFKKRLSNLHDVLR